MTVKFKWIVLGGIVALGLFLRFHTFATRPLWFDEQLQLKDLSKPFFDILFQRPPESPEGFIGDFLLSWPFAQISSNKWVLLLPHIAITCLSLYVFVRIVLAELNSFGAQCVAVLLLCVNRNAIFHSFELRPYSALMALSIFLYAVIPRFLTQTSQSTLSFVLGTLFFFVALVFHAYGPLIVGVLVLFHVWRLRSEGKILSLNYRQPLLIAALLAAPVWLFYASVLSRFGQFGRNTFEYVTPTVMGVCSFIFGNLGDLQLRGLWLLPLLIVIIGIFVRDTRCLERRIGFIVLLVLPILLIGASDLKSGYWFVQRQFVWTLPIWALWVGMSVEAVENKLKRFYA